MEKVLSPALTVTEPTELFAASSCRSRTVAEVALSVKLPPVAESVEYAMSADSSSRGSSASSVKLGRLAGESGRRGEGAAGRGEKASRRSCPSREGLKSLRAQF